jgi:hypothetical protein
MDEKQLRQRLDEARGLILAADARLRFYAFVPNVSEDELELARGDWYAAEDIIWEVLKARAKDVRVIDSFTDVSGALSLLIDTLAVGQESPEQSPPPGAV